MADDNKSDSSVDQNLIRELAKLLDETNLTEIEIERDAVFARRLPIRKLLLRLEILGQIRVDVVKIRMCFGGARHSIDLRCSRRRGKRQAALSFRKIAVFNHGLRQKITKIG
mgnify:CR=1 FL=1